MSFEIDSDVKVVLTRAGQALVQAPFHRRGRERILIPVTSGCNRLFRMDHFRKLRMVTIRKFRRPGAPRIRRSQRWLATLGCTTPMPAPASALLTVDGATPIETPAHINRLAWAWLREFQQDLEDDCDNRLETNNQ